MHSDPDTRSAAYVLGVLLLAVLLTVGVIAYDAVAGRNGQIGAGTVHAIPNPSLVHGKPAGPPLKMVIGRVVVAAAQLAD
ncbi:MAG TPA: hypothetical protein VHW46_02520 [Terracidiphilus sp.]|jgi:hypothetical protein|nr:hypothetical protein [Terracidiphilus sp.]